jgi:cation diffusion facilitator family transporter
LIEGRILLRNWCFKIITKEFLLNKLILINVLDGEDYLQKYKQIARILFIILFLNLIVTFGKIFWGLMFNINSLTADGYHSFTDSISNIIGIIGIKLSSKPADKSHPYGYQKFETIAGFTIGFLLIWMVINIISKAIEWFINPIVFSVTPATLVTLVLTILINGFVAYYEHKMGRKLNSDVLISDSHHTKSDILISLGVLVSLLLIKLGLPPIIDPIVSIVIAIFILFSCLEIFKMTLGVLVDKTVVNEVDIQQIIEAEPEVLNVHKIRSRGRLEHIYIDLHIITEPQLTVLKVHELSHRLENILQEKLNKKVELIAHFEPNER